METIFLQKSTEKLNLSNGQFVHREGDVILKTYPVLTIEQVFVYGNGQITTQALKECLRNGIRVLYFNAYGKFLGRLEPDYPKNIQRRLNQYKLYWTPDQRLAWGKALIQGKVQGQLVELRRMRERKISFPYQRICSALKKARQNIEQAGNTAELLGAEGHCTKIYFTAFPYAMPPGLQWCGRSYFPPADIENHVLSLIYGCCANEIRQLCEHHGLDPHCGFLHEPGYNSGGIIYDLLEPARAVLCDNYAFFIFRKYGNILKKCKTPGGELRRVICDGFRTKLTLRGGRQKSSGIGLLRNILTETVRNIDSEKMVPDFSSLLPNR